MSVEVIAPRRVPVFIGGPSHGERVPEHAWHQPEAHVVTVHLGDRYWEEPRLPSGETVDVHDYFRREIRLTQTHHASAWIYGQIAYSGEGLDATIQWVLDTALEAAGAALD